MKITVAEATMRNGMISRRLSPFLFGRAFFTAIAIASVLNSRGAAAESGDVFSGPVLAYAEAIAETPAASEGVVRIVHVEERAGVARRGDLVRVPVFFMAGECRELSELAIIPAGADRNTASLVWQADDIRRGDDGGISGVHLWFAVDLPAGGRRQYELVRRNERHARDAGSSEHEGAGADVNEEVRFATASGAVIFGSDGSLRRIDGAPNVQWDFGAEGALPRAALRFPGSDGAPTVDLALDRKAGKREVMWSSGPLFHKLSARLTDPQGAALEQTFRIPRHGREIVVSTTIIPGKSGSVSVRENEILEGTPSPVAVVKVPAGIRHALRAEHAYTVSALTTTGHDGALLAVPLVIGGSNGVWSKAEDGRVRLRGLRGLSRGNEGEKDTLHAFWTEVRLVPVEHADGDALWRRYREHVQPLVGVVEEPGVGVDALHAVLREVAREMKPIGWRQEAARALVLGNAERMGKILATAPKPREADVESLLGGARNARAKLTNNGQRPVKEHEKGRAYGGLDPYHITYTQSAAAALAVLKDVPERVGAVNHAMARAVRDFGGKVDETGSPYIDCFSRTLNMQMGPVLFGLTAGARAGDRDLVRFYRDLANAPAVLGIFGRGQRPYSSKPNSGDQSDYLYQAICDYWLRATELLGDENLQLHPLAYARYTDCIDVMADLYHGVAAKDKPDAAGRARANFFRGQTHTHRWLGWSCAPYIRLLEDPAERSAVGLTEAVRYSHLLKGRWKNWPDLTYYLLTDLLVREGLERYRRPELPAAPRDIAVETKAGGTALTWAAVPGAASYRVYRAEHGGGPYMWLNSPHVESPLPELTETGFSDPNAPRKAVYVVTSVDAAGRESAWPKEAE